jgi:hypothetical protein
MNMVFLMALLLVSKRPHYLKMLPHAILGHSQILAEKTQKWVEEIVKIDRAHMTVATKDDE